MTIKLHDPNAPPLKWDNKVTTELLNLLLENETKGDKREIAFAVIDRFLQQFHDATLEEAAKELDETRRKWLREEIHDYDEIRNRESCVHALDRGAMAIRELKTASRGEGSLPAWCGTGIEIHSMGNYTPTKGAGWYPACYGYDPIKEGLCSGAMYWNGETWLNPFTEPFVNFVDEAYSCEDFAHSRSNILEIGC